MEDMIQPSQTDDEEISLIDLLIVLLKRKKLILIGTISVIIIVLSLMLLSLKMPPEKSILPNLYTSKALMLINDSSSSGGSAAALLSSSGLGSLAGLAGVNVGGSTYSDLAVYLTGTNTFLDAIVDEFNFVSRYKLTKYIKSESRKIVKTKLKAEFDTKSGVLSLSFTDIDPVFAQQVINFSVDYLSKRFEEMQLDKNKLQKKNLEENIANTYNEILQLEQKSRELEASVSNGRTAANIPSIMLEANRIKREIAAQEAVYTQLKTQYEMVKIALASETPIFQVLEKAEVPDQKSGPSRGTIMIVTSFTALFFFVFLAFVLEAIDNAKKDPEVLAKLKEVKK
jgi:uncharacterized protein involved in exopolysaccharide biosynthesis